VDQTAATQTTQVTVNVSGLSPWVQFSDGLTLYSFTANLFVGGGDSLNGGVTSGSFTVPWWQMATPPNTIPPNNLLDATDQVEIVQSRQMMTTSGVSYDAPQTWGSL